MHDIYAQVRNNETLLSAVLDPQGNILGLLSSVVQKDFKGFLGHFTARAINWGGPLIAHDDPEVLSYLLEQYNRQFKKKAIFSQFRNYWNQEESKSVFLSRDYDYQEHLNFLVDLELESVDKILDKIGEGVEEGDPMASPSHVVIFGGGTICASCLAIDSDKPGICFLTGHHGRGSACRFPDLEVYLVGLGQGYMIESLKGQDIFLTLHAL